jgi:hypothetical protein
MYSLILGRRDGPLLDREVAMQALSKAKTASPVDNIICAIRHGDDPNTLSKEVQELGTIVRAIGQLLTPEQCVRLKAMDTVKTVLEQDNVAPTEHGWCGSLGGFGTEELDEWEWVRRGPIA